MTGVFKKHLPRLVTTWQASTGEQLIGWEETPPDTLPPAVSQAANQTAEQSIQVQVEGKTWLIARSRQARPDFFLASVDPGGDARQVLATLVSLLDELAAGNDTTPVPLPIPGTPPNGDLEANRLEQELAIASHIQDNFLPKTLPEIPGLDFAASLKPAHRVGGDFYDVQPVENGLAIMIGDVAGKGIPAALLTALIHATLKSEAQHHPQPADLLRSINRLICEELERSETFITAFLAVLYTNPLQLTYASAGHTTTLLWRFEQQEVLQLNSTGLPLGIAPQIELSQRSIPLAPGDVLVLYSDGITEAENAQGRVFGMQALIDLILAVHPAPAASQLDIILSALDLHRGELPLRDDVALFLAHARQADETRIVPFVYTAEKRNVRALARLARQVASDLQFASDEARETELDELELAVSEIASNIILHAYRNYPFTGRIQGRFAIWPDRIAIDLIDNGVAFKPYLEKAPVFLNDPPASGFGLTLARQLLDVCQYTRLPGDRNLWHLEKKVSSRVSHANQN